MAQAASQIVDIRGGLQPFPPVPYDLPGGLKDLDRAVPLVGQGMRAAPGYRRTSDIRVVPRNGIVEAPRLTSGDAVTVNDELLVQGDFTGTDGDYFQVRTKNNGGIPGYFEWRVNGGGWTGTIEQPTNSWTELENGVYVRWREKVTGVNVVWDFYGRDMTNSDLWILEVDPAAHLEQATGEGRALVVVDPLLARAIGLHYHVGGEKYNTTRTRPATIPGWLSRQQYSSPTKSYGGSEYKAACRMKRWGQHDYPEMYQYANKSYISTGLSRNLVFDGKQLRERGIRAPHQRPHIYTHHDTTNNTLAMPGVVPAGVNIADPVAMGSPTTTQASVDLGTSTEEADPNTLNSHVGYQLIRLGYVATDTPDDVNTGEILSSTSPSFATVDQFLIEYDRLVFIINPGIGENAPDAKHDTDIPLNPRQLREGTLAFEFHAQDDFEGDYVSVSVDVPLWQNQWQLVTVPIPAHIEIDPLEAIRIRLVRKIPSDLWAHNSSNGYHYNIGIVSSIGLAQSSGASGNGLSAGDYQAVVTWYDRENDRESDPSPPTGIITLLKGQWFVVDGTGFWGYQWEGDTNKPYSEANTVPDLLHATHMRVYLHRTDMSPVVYRGIRYPRYKLAAEVKIPTTLLDGTLPASGELPLQVLITNAIDDTVLDRGKTLMPLNGYPPDCRFHVVNGDRVFMCGQYELSAGTATIEGSTQRLKMTTALTTDPAVTGRDILIDDDPEVYTIAKVPEREDENAVVIRRKFDGQFSKRGFDSWSRTARDYKIMPNNDVCWYTTKTGARGPDLESVWTFNTVNIPMPNDAPNGIANAGDDVVVAGKNHVYSFRHNKEVLDDSTSFQSPTSDPILHRGVSGCIAPRTMTELPGGRVGWLSSQCRPVWGDSGGFQFVPGSESMKQILAGYGKMIEGPSLQHAHAVYVRRFNWWVFGFVGGIATPEISGFTKQAQDMYNFGALTSALADPFEYQSVTPYASTFRTTALASDFYWCVAYDIDNGVFIPLGDLPMTAFITATSDGAVDGQTPDRVFGLSYDGYISKCFEETVLGWGTPSARLVYEVDSGGSTTVDIPGTVHSAHQFGTDTDGNGLLENLVVALIKESPVYTVQLRRISSNTGTRITVDTAWDTDPVSGDKIIVGPTPALIRTPEFRLKNPGTPLELIINAHHEAAAHSSGTPNITPIIIVRVYTQSGSKPFVDYSSPATTKIVEFKNLDRLRSMVRLERVEGKAMAIELQWFVPQDGYFAITSVQTNAVIEVGEEK